MSKFLNSLSGNTEIKSLVDGKLSIDANLSDLTDITVARVNLGMSTVLGDITTIQSQQSTTNTDISILQSNAVTSDDLISTITTTANTNTSDITALTTTVNTHTSNILDLQYSQITLDGLISNTSSIAVGARNKADANTLSIATNTTNIGSDSKRVIPSFNKKMASVVSLRKVVETATLCCRIRESNTNTEIDVGFDANGIIDKTVIDLHVGAFDPYIVRWYDQTGQGVDFITLNSTQARESKLIWSTINGVDNIPEAEFNGLSDGTGNHYVCVRNSQETGYNDPGFGNSAVFRITSRTGSSTLFGSNWAYYLHHFTSDTNFRVGIDASVLNFNLGVSAVGTGMHTLSCKTENFSTNVRFDGVETAAQTSGVNDAIYNPVGFGGAGNVETGKLHGAINEHIVWMDTPTSAELLALEDQQNAIWVAGDVTNNTPILYNIEYNERKVNSSLLLDTTTESFAVDEGALVCSSIGCLGNVNMGGALKVQNGIGVGVYTTFNRLRIFTPYAGLMVYDSDLLAMYFHTGTAWKKITAV